MDPSGEVRPPNIYIFNRPWISSPTHLVPFLYDKVKNLDMGNPPWALLMWSDPANIYYLNRPLISFPTHLVPSLYKKVEKLVMGNPLGPLC